eukprot:gnl/Hemi2/259_TR72_c0_g7_i1.p1 gnl/Hemi2/259_TR72_c0_g7~~gnl/Hemi2/259_TR72_c0_g7_i1.p1  ORF type:complete len:830 (-),score=87.77 gnl/Hemi2/259_TR72_c0_g7_i1:206-2413(-)
MASEPARVPCPRGCASSFKTAKLARRHVQRIHEKKEQFVCPDCGQEFSRADNLDRHVSGNYCRKDAGPKRKASKALVPFDSSKLSKKARAPETIDPAAFFLARERARQSGAPDLFLCINGCGALLPLTLEDISHHMQAGCPAPLRLPPELWACNPVIRDHYVNTGGFNASNFLVLCSALHLRLDHIKPARCFPKVNPKTLCDILPGGSVGPYRAEPCQLLVSQDDLKALDPFLRCPPFYKNVDALEFFLEVHLILSEFGSLRAAFASASKLTFEEISDMIRGAKDRVYYRELLLRVQTSGRIVILTPEERAAGRSLESVIVESWKKAVEREPRLAKLLTPQCLAFTFPTGPQEPARFGVRESEDYTPLALGTLYSLPPSYKESEGSEGSEGAQGAHLMSVRQDPHFELLSQSELAVLSLSALEANKLFDDCRRLHQQRVVVEPRPKAKPPVKDIRLEPKPFNVFSYSSLQQVFDAAASCVFPELAGLSQDDLQALWDRQLEEPLAHHYSRLEFYLYAYFAWVHKTSSQAKQRQNLRQDYLAAFPEPDPDQFTSDEHFWFARQTWETAHRFTCDGPLFRPVPICLPLELTNEEDFYPDFTFETNYLAAVAHYSANGWPQPTRELVRTRLLNNLHRQLPYTEADYLKCRNLLDGLEGTPGERKLEFQQLFRFAVNPLSFFELEHYVEAWRSQVFLPRKMSSMPEPETLTAWFNDRCWWEELDEPRPPFASSMYGTFF